MFHVYIVQSLKVTLYSILTRFVCILTITCHLSQEFCTHGITSVLRMFWSLDSRISDAWPVGIFQTQWRNWAKCLGIA